VTKPKNTSGLKPWQKGQSGNPGGRPKKRPVTDEYAALADVEVPAAILKKLKLPPGLTFGQANGLRRWLDSLKPGGHMASKEIRESIEGKAPQRVEISGPDRREITIRLMHDRTPKPRK